MTEPTRSPIKDKPLRLPGQSLMEERDAIWNDKLGPWALVAAFFVVLAGWEWFRYFHPVQPNPILVSACALVALAFAAWRLLRLRPHMRALRQGIEGEKAVGQFLERLREQGYQVFHDLVGEGFNVDHVLIGPAGVFTIETKTWSKPQRGDARIAYDGNTLTAAGRVPDRDPLAQAMAQAHWLRGLLFESTGHRVAVQPVVVFPGWFVEAAPGAQRSVWVMEPKGLPAFLNNAPQCLTAEQVKLSAYHLARHVRSVERERKATA
jgi:Nuclease-related domain